MEENFGREAPSRAREGGIQLKLSQVRLGEVMTDQCFSTFETKKIGGTLTWQKMTI
jgi:hypothetical protein